MATREEFSFAQKLFVVQRLAVFDPPSTVIKAFKEEFGFEPAPSRISFYDPNNKQAAALDPALKAKFEETRKTFLANVDTIPIANMAVRLRRLDRMANAAETRGNLVLAAEFGEKAAKEIGGAFTNVRKLSGKLDVDATVRAAPAAVDAVLDQIFGDAVAAIVQPEPPAAGPAASGPVLPESAAGSGAAGTGVPAPGETVAEPERSVLLADDDLPPQGP